MCTKWLCVDALAYVKNLLFIFRVTGHSFCPPDRVFARIEKIIKKDIIVSPEEFLEILNYHGTVFTLGRDVTVYDWKKDSQTAIKPPAQWHVRFNVSKRFLLRRGKNRTETVRGEQSYKSDLGKYKYVFKKKSVESIIQAFLLSGVCPNKKKLKDVKVLLERHWGENCSELENIKYHNNFLKKIL